MATKLSEGDTIAMQGEVTAVHDDGTVTVRLHGYGVPVTTRGEHLRQPHLRADDAQTPLPSRYGSSDPSFNFLANFRDCVMRP